MDLALSLVAEVLLLVAVALDLRRLRRRGDTRGELEPFRIWLLRVYFFSVLALPFYFWRTRGRARWALVGVASAILYVLVLEGAVGLVAGCAASSTPSRADAHAASEPRGRTGDGGTVAPVAADVEVDAALRKLRSARFPDVLAAHDLLVRAASPRVVAALVELAASSQRVPLVDTADLIYPGTRRFYGHGLVLPYDVDRLGARAGWVLEEVTFQDFGFSRAPHPDATEPAERPDAAARAVAWWTAQNGRFSRIDALASALRAPAGAKADAVLGVAGTTPLDPAVRSALADRLVPALVAGLASNDPAGRTLACRVARVLAFRELTKTDPRVREPLARTLAGDATLVAAIRTTLAPEIAFETDVPGATEILAPAYSVHARDAIVELLDRLAYARGADHVGVELGPGRMVVFAGDLGREAQAWRRWLVAD